MKMVIRSGGESIWPSKKKKSVGRCACCLVLVFWKLKKEKVREERRKKRETAPIVLAGRYLYRDKSSKAVLLQESGWSLCFLFVCCILLSVFWLACANWSQEVYRTACQAAWPASLLCGQDAPPSRKKAASSTTPHSIDLQALPVSILRNWTGSLYTSMATMVTQRPRQWPLGIAVISAASSTHDRQPTNLSNRQDIAQDRETPRTSLFSISSASSTFFSATRWRRRRSTSTKCTWNDRTREEFQRSMLTSTARGLCKLWSRKSSSKTGGRIEAMPPKLAHSARTTCRMIWQLSRIEPFVCHKLYSPMQSWGQIRISKKRTFYSLGNVNILPFLSIRKFKENQIWHTWKANFIFLYRSRSTYNFLYVTLEAVNDLNMYKTTWEEKEPDWTSMVSKTWFPTVVHLTFWVYEYVLTCTLFHGIWAGIINVGMVFYTVMMRHTYELWCSAFSYFLPNFDWLIDWYFLLETQQAKCA